jgi:hypothetical protein
MITKIEVRYFSVIDYLHFVRIATDTIATRGNKIDRADYGTWAVASVNDKFNQKYKSIGRSSSPCSELYSFPKTIPPVV